MNGTDGADSAGGAGPGAAGGAADPSGPWALSPEAVVRERDRWRCAGEQLWATAMADPDTYRRLTAAVGTAVDRLRAAEDLADLVAMADELQRDDGPGPGAGMVTAATVVGAACAVRADEIEARARGAASLVAIEDARRAGRAWAVLVDGPLRRVEMHVPTGIALVATVDPYSGEGPYALEEVVLDTTTGALLADGPGGQVRFLDDEAWRRGRDERRGEIEDVHGRDRDDGGVER